MVLSKGNVGLQKMASFSEAMEKFQGGYMGVEPKIGGKPPKWMVSNGKPYFLMDDLGVPLFLETPISLLRPCISSFLLVHGISGAQIPTMPC